MTRIDSRGMFADLGVGTASYTGDEVHDMMDIGCIWKICWKPMVSCRVMALRVTAFSIFPARGLSPVS